MFVSVFGISVYNVICHIDFNRYDGTCRSTMNHKILGVVMSPYVVLVVLPLFEAYLVECC
jgi:hypothetical protein